MLRTYYEVPVDIIEDAEQLTTWAGRAVLGKCASELPCRRFLYGSFHVSRLEAGKQLTAGAV